MEFFKTTYYPINCPPPIHMFFLSHLGDNWILALNAIN